MKIFCDSKDTKSNRKDYRAPRSIVRHRLSLCEDQHEKVVKIPKILTSQLDWPKESRKKQKNKIIIFHNLKTPVIRSILVIVLVL